MLHAMRGGVLRQRSPWRAVRISIHLCATLLISTLKLYVRCMLARATRE